MAKTFFFYFYFYYVVGLPVLIHGAGEVEELYYFVLGELIVSGMTGLHGLLEILVKKACDIPVFTAVALYSALYSGFLLTVFAVQRGGTSAEVKRFLIESFQRFFCLWRQGKYPA